MVADGHVPASEAEPSDEGYAPPNRRAWLVLAVGEDRQHGGNDGYDDDPATHYSWDSTVPNHSRLHRGDVIALWDKKSLIGVSVIEEILIGANEKALYRCPKCGMAGIKRRRTVTPEFKCYKCKDEFSTPDERRVDVTTYQASYDMGWVDLAGRLSGRELRALCGHPDSQLSLRGLRWAHFRTAVEAASDGERLTVLDAAADQQGPSNGHRAATVRVRVGQGSFRRRLLQEYGSICAFTGPAPTSVLEAGHLYSYAETGQHHPHGGLLFRRDLHRLFDLGHLAVNPETGTVDVGDGLAPYPAYALLTGQPLQVELTNSQKDWLRIHWREHRESSPPRLVAENTTVEN